MTKVVEGRKRPQGRFNFRRTSVTGFQAQSISSSNTIALDLPYLLVLNTEASQSRQHVDTSLIHIESRKPPTAELFDVDSGRISIRHLKQSLDAEQVYLDSLLAQRVAEEQEREIRASAEQLTLRQSELDKIDLNLTNEEWIGLVDQVQANPTLSTELLGVDVSEDTFSV
nr:hypothetical protein [Tanacetum cinerariifolium]